MAYNHRAIEETFYSIEEQERLAIEVLNKFVKSDKDLPFTLRDDVISLKDLRIAAIMDGFTLESYAPECNLLELTSTNWMKEINAFQPDLLFIESAWNGKGNSWFRKVDRRDCVVSELIGFCRGKGIPVIFWNKEDPVSTAPFIPTAKLCDYIFTTDADCIVQYKLAVDHNRVYHLHFAAQPKIHNPIEKYERKHKICFAGAYYPRYPDRIRIMEDFTKIFSNREGIDIYDRNYDDPSSPYAFPDMYKPYIIGKLKSKEIDIAYKGYRYGMNMNSISQSQTMFARRVFELLASNTVVVGNFSRGIKNYFGDLTICTDFDKTLMEALGQYCGDEVTYRKFRLLGLRKVLSEHLYEDRLDRIAQIVFGKSLKRTLPLVYVIARCDTPEEIERIKYLFSRQNYENKELLILKNDQYIELGEMNSFVTMFDVENYYGKNYLYDLMLSGRYSDADGFCKPIDPLHAYKFVDSAPLKRCAIRSSLVEGRLLSSVEVIQGKLLCIDEFNYKEKCALDNCHEADDLEVLDCGIDLNILEQAYSIDTSMPYGTLDITPQQMMDGIKLPPQSPFECSIEEDMLKIQSCQQPIHSQYIFIPTRYKVADYNNRGCIKVCFQAEGALNVMGVCWFHDKGHMRMGAEFIETNKVQKISIPKETEYFKFGFRILGDGIGFVRDIKLCKRDHVLFDQYYTRCPAIVMTNIYPAPDNIYRNMFVHRRIQAYKEYGLNMDVMRFGVGSFKLFREFEGVNVIEGRKETFEKMMQNDPIQTICIHFLRQDMWETIKPYLHRLRIIIWCHGAEIQPWWRRTFNYKDENELNKAKEESIEREALWKDVFEHLEHENIHLIFVSQYFADEVSEDYQVNLPKNKYSIIHNLIDTDFFRYEKKDVGLRKNLLSIRPYASEKYANDLTTKCICELAKRPFFQDLHFRIVGSGRLFDEINEPLTKYPNVQLENRFLLQSEIAELHKEYGIFLTPTRMDAQGVSRDEAMASGLVPVTNSVTAIPEFTDDTCAILAPEEDYMAMAEGIEKLYYNPELFSQMSENAARRVRNQSDKIHTIDKEVSLIKSRLYRSN